MIRLDSTVRSIQAVLNAALTTNNMPVVICYSDKTTTGYNGGTFTTATNGTTPVTICPAPAASTVRDIDFISIYNADTASKTVTLSYNDNGTLRGMVDIVMNIDDRLVYTHANGWQIASSAGGTVTSVFGRAGVVTAQASDYSAFYLGYDTGYSTDFPNFTATVATNALTGTLTNPLTLNFRNATAGTGTPVRLAIAANLTLTVPSGATLGTANNVATRLVWLVAYNGGTPVLCVTNEAGGLQLDETNLISPTTISGTSNSANVIYSASAVGANSPYRVIGFSDVTEATAGTWATAPSTVQGIGGEAISMASFGFGQTQQNFTVGTQRVNGTTYYAGSKPIQVIVQGGDNVGQPWNLSVTANNGAAMVMTSSTGSGNTQTFIFTVLPWNSYVVTWNASARLSSWQEIR